MLALGFKIGKIDYRDHISSDEVLELRHDGKTLKVGDALRKTSVIDLVVGNGKGSYRTSGDAAQDVINDAEELDDAGF